MKWIKEKYGKSLIIVSQSQKDFMKTIEKAISSGDTVLLENIDESLDVALDPILNRNFIKKGMVIKIDEREINYDPNFRLILQTKLANPHYKPEIQAQTTLINFTVTYDGLEQQFLAEVVKAERPDLEEMKSSLTMQQNNFKIILKSLEDQLLVHLATAGENVLADSALTENLEETKRTTAEIEEKAQETVRTTRDIDTAREIYRPVAQRAAILYFILSDLCKINAMYQFSLKSFVVVFKRAIASTPKRKAVEERVAALLESITHAVHLFTCRGLFERDKLIYKLHLALQISLLSKEITANEISLLLRFPHSQAIQSPFEFLTNDAWSAIKALASFEGFHDLDKDFEASTKRWKKFVESEAPELEKLPGEWKSKSHIRRLCILRAVRPDRMQYAISCFVSEVLGHRYSETHTFSLAQSFHESRANMPIFFILSPGVDPLVDVEKLGSSLHFSSRFGSFHNVSLGQGQEKLAEAALDVSLRKGHWLVLQNIHLVSKWLPRLEKHVEESLESAHKNFRMFITAEAATRTSNFEIPQGILAASIKITNESPTGMRENLHAALGNFRQEVIDACTKEAEFKSILFALCYFHAVVTERRKFGPQGWNTSYPFSMGDLTICGHVLFNYVEENRNIPYDDLRYLFGEIMYGGHITDEWDRRLCRTYLDEFIQPTLLTGDLAFCHDFDAPPNLDLNGYHQYINDCLPSESPTLYGMHLNAEVIFLTELSNRMFQKLLDLQPRDFGNTYSVHSSLDDNMKQIIEEIMDKIPEHFPLGEIMSHFEERTPFSAVIYQECERMNALLAEMMRSLQELQLGHRGELSMTNEMEELYGCILLDNIPLKWLRLSYPTDNGLQLWFADLVQRHREIASWANDCSLPPSIWLPGLFSPQSFLTAVMQVAARKNESPLDRMCLNVEITTQKRDDVL